MCLFRLFRLINNNCLDLSNDTKGTVLYYLPLEITVELRAQYCQQRLKLPKLNADKMKTIRRILKKRNRIGSEEIMKELNKEGVKESTVLNTFSIYSTV